MSPTDNNEEYLIFKSFASGSVSPNSTPALTPVSAAFDNLTPQGSARSKSPTPESTATPESHLSALESIKALNTGGSLQSTGQVKSQSATSSINQKSAPNSPPANQLQSDLAALGTDNFAENNPGAISISSSIFR